MSSECDLVFTAVPHGTATEIVKTFYDRGTRVIDLSADFRLHNPSDYDKWYGWTHPHPNYLEKSVFGAELHREKIKDAKIVSCPGCMACLHHCKYLRCLSISVPTLYSARGCDKFWLFSKLF